MAHIVESSAGAANLFAAAAAAMDQDQDLSSHTINLLHPAHLSPHMAVVDRLQHHNWQTDGSYYKL